MPPNLARVARRQYGVFSRNQALGAGMSVAQVRRRVRRGDWVRVGPDVYAVAGLPGSAMARLWACWLSIGPPMWFTGLAAAGLWELEPLPALRGIDIVVPEAGIWFAVH